MLLVTPPKAAQRVARRALDRRAKLPKYKRGGLSAKEASAQGITSGVEQARRIAAGDDVDLLQVRRFFSRFKSTYEKAKRSGKKWEDSKMLQSWDLWGGEPMRKFVMKKKRNRCYASRYSRYRNFSAPKKKKAETWTQYHDRLAAMAFEARRRGAANAAQALEERAGEIVAKHKLVRTKKRKGSKGPGTYPWSQCVADARKRGARDPKAVCGAIRAKSKKRYPAYWKSRDAKKKNPSKKDVRTLMEASAVSVAEGLDAKNATARANWFVSAAMYAGAAMAHASEVRDPAIRKEASALGNQVRYLIVESQTWKRPKSRSGSKKKSKKSAKQKNRSSTSIKRGFMRI